MSAQVIPLKPGYPLKLEISIENIAPKQVRVKPNPIKSFIHGSIWIISIPLAIIWAFSTLAICILASASIHALKQIS